MIRAFCLALGDLGDPAVRRALWRSLLLSFLALFALVAGLETFLLESHLFATGWLDTAVDVFGGLISLVLATVLYPAVAAAVTGLFGEQVVEAVERRHYPGLPPLAARGLLDGVGPALRFSGVVLALNLLAIPFYFIPVVNLGVFFILNGYLLGREYLELVALRRLAPEAVQAFRRRHGVTLFLCGLIVAFLLPLPLVNLLVPVIASAFLTHVFWQRHKPSP